MHFGAGAGNVLGRTRTFPVMSLQSWWFLKTDRGDYKNTRVTQVERCYAGWNKSWGGWYRAWNATSEPVKETDQSCLKKTFPRTILVLGKDLFWGAKKEEARERLMFVVHRSLLKHWKIQMFENLNRLSKSANMKMFRSSSVSAPLLSGFGRQR